MLGSQGGWLIWGKRLILRQKNIKKGYEDEGNGGSDKTTVCKPPKEEPRAEEAVERKSVLVTRDRLAAAVMR